jgi:hypothetical protein
MIRLSRRYVAATAAAAVGPIVALLWTRRAHTTAEEADAVRRLAALARAYGLAPLGAYRRGVFAARLNVPRILHELLPGQSLREVSELPEARMEECLRRAILADFAHGRLVPVGGWFLARTEAHLCALATL